MDVEIPNGQYDMEFTKKITQLQEQLKKAQKTIGNLRVC